MNSKKKTKRLYYVWRNIKNRCFNPNCPEFKYYGARGITMCAEWKNDYKAFHSWAIENGYDENAPRGECTIDRIDVNGNYEPSNCRWVSMLIQAHNRRGSQMHKEIWEQKVQEEKIKAQRKKIEKQAAAIFEVAMELAMRADDLSKGELPFEGKTPNFNVDYKLIDFAGRKMLIAVID